MTDKHVTEPVRQTPVMAEADVLVAGAGPAGLGAAIGAARSGANTLLVEKHGCLGGMLTAGGVINIRQYNDDEKLIIDGVGGELARRIKAAGGTENDPEHGKYVRHDPEITRLVADEMVAEAGVRALLHTWLADAIVEDGRVTGAIVENKSGRGAILAKVTIDATGDGDVIARSGAEFVQDDDLQPMTLACVIGGVDCWPKVRSQEMREKVQAAIEDGTYPIRRGPGLFPMWRKGEVYANATRISGDCTDAWDLSRAEFEGRRQLAGMVRWLRENVRGYENCFLMKTAPQVGLRESRLLVGVYTLTREDVMEYRQFDDAICLSAYGIDIHYKGLGGEMTWLEPGKSHGIPYRCCLPETMDGLLAAGRCISATHDAMGATRVMATGLAIGHGAGVAAALSSKAGVRPRDVDIQQVRETLRRQKAILRDGRASRPG